MTVRDPGSGWRATIRPQIPGPVLELIGRPKDWPDDVVFIALMQDEATYRTLANNPDQDAFYWQLMTLIDGEISWEDVELEIAVNDDGPPAAESIPPVSRREP